MPRKKSASILPKLAQFISWLAFAGFVLTVLLALLSILKVISSRAPITSQVSPIALSTHTVNYVHDGDTVYIAPHNQSVRLIGIDAPELAGSYRCGVDAKCDRVSEECGATEAKEKLKELVLNREVVVMEDKTVESTDKYGRWLRYVFLCRGAPRGRPWAGARPAPTTNLSSTDYRLLTTDSSCLDLSLELIRHGLVRESGFGNTYSNQKQYRQAQLEAKTKKLGIWGICE